MTSSSEITAVGENPRFTVGSYGPEAALGLAGQPACLTASSQAGLGPMAVDADRLTEVLAVRFDEVTPAEIHVSADDGMLWYSSDLDSGKAGSYVRPAPLLWTLVRWAAERFRKIVCWSRPGMGGHFAAFEQPEVFVSEVRTALRAIRQAL